jgi:TM2 domain-containing membrane protein YozV
MKQTRGDKNIPIFSWKIVMFLLQCTFAGAAKILYGHFILGGVYTLKNSLVSLHFTITMIFHAYL